MSNFAHILHWSVIASAALLSACVTSEPVIYANTADIESAPFPRARHVTADQSHSDRIAVARKFARSVETTITFEVGSANLTSHAKQALDEQALFIKAHPNFRFTVYGHADGTGSPPVNRKLAHTRALAVRNYFITQGVADSQLADVVTLGQDDPRYGAGPDQNRRAVTELSGFVPNLRIAILDAALSGRTSL